MQKFEDTVITDNGLNLLTTVNDGDDKIQYTKAVLASNDFTQASATAIQKITDLTIKMDSTINIHNRINDTINLSASFTNETITEDFDFYCIGWYAKGVKDSTEYLIAISPSTVKQTMPAGSNNAATASIGPKYAMTLSRNAEVVVNAEPAGSVTKEYVDNQVNALIDEGIINNGSIVSTTDDCDKMITTGYHLIKGSLPLHVPDGFSTNGQIIVYGNKDTTDGVTQLAYDDINGASYVRSYNPTNNKWSVWNLIITKSQLNAVLPSDIARTGEDNEFKGKNTFDTDPVNKDGNAYGLVKDIDTKVTDNGDNSIEINKQAITPVRDNKDDSINFNSKDMTPADDSKVVHTSGDEDISGMKNFTGILSVGSYDPVISQKSLQPVDTDFADVNQVDGTNGNAVVRISAGTSNLPDATNPYDVRTYNNGGNLVQQAFTENKPDMIYQRTFTTSQNHWGDWHVIGQVPSTLADTTKLANFTAGLQSGGVQVATSDDLKSVEAKAWRELNDPLDCFYMKDEDVKKYFSSASILYQIDTDNKCILVNLIANVTTNETTATSSGLDIFFDLSSIIDSIKTVNSSLLVLPVETNYSSSSYRTNIGFVGNPLDNSFSSAIVEWKIDTSGGWPGTMDEIYFSLADGFTDYGLQRTNAKFYYNNLQPGVI